MKHPLLALLATSSILFAAKDKYTQILYQIEYDADGNYLTEYQVDVAKDGSIDALDGVDHSSKFELYCIHNESNTTTFIAEQLVTAYLPKGSISIQSLDPNLSEDGTPRTRVDQPYSLSYTVSGLLVGDLTVQLAARTLNFDKDIILFANGEVKPTKLATTTNTQTTITTNGKKISSYKNQVLSARSGQAVYSISTLLDYGTTDAPPLDTKKINIWPLSSGDLTGLTAGSTYSTLPKLTISVNDIYPLSSVKLRITNLTTGNVCVSNQGQSKNTTDYAKGDLYSVDGNELANCFPTDDSYRVELIEDSDVFGIRVLDTFEPITILRTIYLNGHFASMK